MSFKVNKENTAGIGLTKVYGPRNLYEGGAAVQAGNLGSDQVIEFTFSREANSVAAAQFVAPYNGIVVNASIVVAAQGGGTGNVTVSAAGTSLIGVAAGAAVGTFADSVTSRTINAGQVINVAVPGTATGDSAFKARVTYRTLGKLDGTSGGTGPK